MPAVSVILPTCDRPELWPRALDSVLRQTWTDFELLLIDSNRRERPLRENPALLSRLGDPRIVLVEREHAPSAAAARNSGLSMARGEWITYLDDDDVYLPGKISGQLQLARSSNSPMVLCGYMVVMPRRRRPRQVTSAAFEGDALLNEANWGTPMLFHKRDACAVFDETLPAGEDEVFAHAFLERHGIGKVPNCAQSLVEVFPQTFGMRVHRSDKLWAAYRANWRRVRTRYTRAGVRRYLAKGLIVRAQGGHGGAGHFMRCAGLVFRTHGLRGWRLVANASAHRFGILSKWVVS